ncbi:MAG: holo-ACP synthase [Candidatus Bipolaricaulota bacterium]|nr:holo-ACP synthase [Candidatus Bipolaricaulota bacterium]
MARVGIDAVEVARFRHLYDRYGERFLRRLYTSQEISYAFAAKGARCFERLAARFAVKEALIKAIGRPIPLLSIEVRHAHTGRPIVFCSQVKEKIEASLTHTDQLAIAFVILEVPTS